jgi:hypothetical protein
MMIGQLAKCFPPQLLGVTWQRAESADSASVRERTLLLDYTKRFGELPPMNAQ